MSDSRRTTRKAHKAVPLVDLTAAYQLHAETLRRSLDKVLQSGTYVLGENVLRFEEEFALYSGVDYGVGVGSGTDALTLSLMALDIKRGDEVITVANTASPTAMAILNSGGRPVFVDPSPDSFLMETASLKKGISKRTKAIIPVHLYGNPCEMETIMEYASEHDLFVIEDCAQSHGAVFKGRSVGCYGDVGCYSFYPTKNLGGFGDGGMVVTKSQALAERIRSLRMYGMRGVYSSRERGLCSRLDEIQAAILRVKLRHLSAENSRRRKNASRYRRLMAGVSGLRFQAETPGGKHVYHQCVIVVGNRDRVREKLSKAGIGTGVHYPVALCDQPAFRKYSSASSYPISRRLSETVVSLPVHPYLNHDAIDYVCSRLIPAVVEAN